MIVGCLPVTVFILTIYIVINGKVNVVIVRKGKNTVGYLIKVKDYII